MDILNVVTDREGFIAGLEHLLRIAKNEQDRNKIQYVEIHLFKEDGDYKIINQYFKD